MGTSWTSAAGRSLGNIQASAEGSPEPTATGPRRGETGSRRRTRPAPGTDAGSNRPQGSNLPKTEGEGTDARQRQTTPPPGARPRAARSGVTATGRPRPTLRRQGEAGANIAPALPAPTPKRKRAGQPRRRARGGLMRAAQQAEAAPTPWRKSESQPRAPAKGETPHPTPPRRGQAQGPTRARRGPHHAEDRPMPDTGETGGGTERRSEKKQLAAPLFARKSPLPDPIRLTPNRRPAQRVSPTTPTRRQACVRVARPQRLPEVPLALARQSQVETSC